LLFRTTVKQLMAHLGTGPAAQLKKMKSLTDNVPPNVTAKDVEFNSFRARWIKPKGQAATKKTILMLPGGGFFFPASSWHTSMLASVCRKAKCQGLLVHYRLAPDHPFPAGLEDAVNAYKYLLEQGIAPEDIVLMGDSAGGGLSLSLLLAIRDEGLPMPKAATLISPLADLSFSTPSRDFNRWRDPMLPTRRKMEAFQLYTGDTPSDDPLLSPIYGDLSGLPPLYAHVSSTEILLDDTLRVARKARAAGVEVEVEVWEGLPHVWHLCAFMPESDKALTHIARFFKRQFKQAPALTLV
jgi:acetyl esterase/lipase